MGRGHFGRAFILLTTGTLDENSKLHTGVVRFDNKREKLFGINIVLMYSVVSHSLGPHGLDSPPSSSVHGIFQEWVATSSSKESSGTRGRTHSSCGSCLGRQISYR